jgi:hypothetical protein
MSALATLRRRFASARGFSAVETATLMAAVSMLTAVAAPSVDEYVSQARMTKAMSDTKVIAVALVRLTLDVGRQERLRGWGDTVLLVGGGNTPKAGAGGDIRWTIDTGGPAADVGMLLDHLVTNGVGYTTKGNAGSWGGWRGPYIDGALGADPWGNRYAVNVRWLGVATPFDTVVLSGGPNGLVETPFGRDGLTPGGDDVVAVVSSGN